VTDDDDGLTVT